MSACTLSALALCGSNRYPNHSLTSPLPHTEHLSIVTHDRSFDTETIVHRHRLIPSTLFALIATPSHVPHIRSARSASSDLINLATSTAMCGYAVSSSDSATPTSTVEETSGEDMKSALMAFLYDMLASSLSMAMRRA